MNKERFLDVNGFSTEYDIPLEKRLNKYRNGKYKDASRISITETEKLSMQSSSWWSAIRRKQIITALVAIIVFALAIAGSVYLTFFL